MWDLFCEVTSMKSQLTDQTNLHSIPGDPTDLTILSVRLVVHNARTI